MSDRIPVPQVPSRSPQVPPRSPQAPPRSPQTPPRSPHSPPRFPVGTTNQQQSNRAPQSLPHSSGTSTNTATKKRLKENRWRKWSAGLRTKYTNFRKRCRARRKECSAKCKARSLKCSQAFTRAWDKVDTNHHFLLCIPLSTGAVMIALLGILYSVFGVYSFIIITSNREMWSEVYKNKMDMLITMYLFVVFVALLSIPSVVLLLGVLIRKQVPILIYLCCCVLHLFSIWSITFGVIGYCFYSCIFKNGVCFMGPGQVQAALVIVLAIVYSFIWMYMIVCVNSFRKLECHRKAKVVRKPIPKVPQSQQACAVGVGLQTVATRTPLRGQPAQAAGPPKSPLRSPLRNPPRSPTPPPVPQPTHRAR